ncbi:CinA family protein [Arcanobacterium haemolyticum]|nr:CinA family protein [Arcanobacterium haemolyticum]
MGNDRQEPPVENNDVSAYSRLAAIIDYLEGHHLSLGVAESLTGGALAATIVDLPGVSSVFRGGIVSYATDVKSSVLGVSRDRLAQTGPVDREVAIEMARGACRVLGCDLAVATTGVAGPGPADGHDAGTVWIGVAGTAGESAHLLHLTGDRAQVRAGAVEGALLVLSRVLGV